MTFILSSRSLGAFTERLNATTPAIRRAQYAFRSFHSRRTGKAPLQKCNTVFHFNDSPYRSTSIRRIHKLQGASTRDMAELEDRIYSVVGSSVKDPEVKVDLKTLGWMNRRIAISEDGTIQILLRLPTLLHPGLDELKRSIKTVAENEIKDWAATKGINTPAKANIEAIATKPVSWLVKDEEDQIELESRLGPGLANVAHVIGVYSCKVRRFVAASLKVILCLSSHTMY
jgi:hypothetical protein